MPLLSDVINNYHKSLTQCLCHVLLSLQCNSPCVSWFTTLLVERIICTLISYGDFIFNFSVARYLCCSWKQIVASVVSVGISHCRPGFSWRFNDYSNYWPFGSLRYKQSCGPGCTNSKEDDCKPAVPGSDLAECTHVLYVVGKTHGAQATGSVSNWQVNFFKSKHGSL